MDDNGSTMDQIAFNSGLPNRRSPVNSGEDNSEIQLLSVEENDTKSSCKTRLYSDYHLNQRSLPTTLGGEQSSVSHSTLATVQNDDSEVLSIQLGTRYNSSGILTLSTNTTINTTNNTINTTNNTLLNSNSMNLKNEHERRVVDMMYENYAVDDVKYKSHSDMKSYTRDGSNYCYTASFGGVSVNPSGITEKVYFNPIAFDTDLTKNNHHIIQSDTNTTTPSSVPGTTTTPTGNTSSTTVKSVKSGKRRLTKEEVGEDIFGPWIPYEEGELPVHSGATTTTTTKSDKSDTKAKINVGKGLVKCTPEKAEALNEVITADGKQFTQFNSVTVSTYNRKIDTKYKPILSTKSSYSTHSTNTHYTTNSSRGETKCYIPKSEVAVMTGHTMSVYRIEFIPSGNLLLSCGMDGFVKLWDINTHKCLRNYKAHVKGVRDINFIENGNKFYSLSFDSNAILWDTEYGKVIGVYRIDKTPYCLTPYPLDSNIFLVGGDNNKILQLDSRTGEVALEYSEHMGCVNTITFIDNNKRIVTTGDDKRVLVWDYNIPVVVKSVSSPEIHTIPAVTPHPSHKFILAQSMDNQVLVYETSASRFKLFGRKRFRGHQNSGYAIKPSCSPDGRYVTSGDSRGKLFIWDWKTCKLLQTFNAHKMALMDSKWHPTHNSIIATCSWDGSIKLFQ